MCNIKSRQSPNNDKPIWEPVIFFKKKGKKSHVLLVQYAVCQLLTRNVLNINKIIIIFKCICFQNTYCVEHA